MCSKMGTVWTLRCALGLVLVLGAQFQAAVGQTVHVEPVFPADIQISFDPASRHVEMSADAILGIKGDPKEFSLKLYGSFVATIQNQHRRGHRGKRMGTVVSRISNFTLQGYSYELGAVAITQDQDESRTNYVSDTRLYNLVNATLVRELMGVYLQLTLEWSPRPRKNVRDDDGEVDADIDCAHKYGHPEVIAYTRYKGAWKSTAHDHDMERIAGEKTQAIFHYPHQSQRFILDHEVRFLWEDDGHARIAFQNKEPFVLKRCDITARKVKPGEESWPRTVNIANIGFGIVHRDPDEESDDDVAGDGRSSSSRVSDSYLKYEIK